MATLGVENVTKIFESRPIESATWLVSLEAIAAIQRVVKDAKVIEIPEEQAANRVIKSLGNGDYHSVLRYFTRPEIHPPGMVSYAQQLGARSLRGNLDPSLMAVLTYKTDKTMKARVDHNIPAFEFYENADGFQGHFVRIAHERASSEMYPSLLDLTLTIKNQTAFWIDKETTS